MIRRASSPVLPLAIRAVASPRSFHGAIATAVNVHERTILSPKSFFQSQSGYSSAASPSGAKKAVDDNLIRIINSEIKTFNPMQEFPKGFPFGIEDNSAEGTIVLTRQDADETVKIEVDMSALESSLPAEEDSDSSDSESDDDTDNDSDDDSCEETNTDKNKDDNENKTSDCDDDNGDDSDDSHDDSDSDDNGGEDSNKEKKRGSDFPMTVSLIKGNGLALEFDVMASADNIKIQCLAIKESIDDVDEYDGRPRFWDLEPALNHALHSYLEIRGIKPSMAEDLQKYIKNKSRKDDLQWLKKLKKFIKNKK